jgi:co-chaperonin GroES (HSP10)
MKIRPRNDKVLVELDDFEKMFGEDSAIIRPEIAFDKPLWGTVRGVGPGKYSRKGVFLRTTLRPGDRVLVPWVRGHDLSIAGKLHVMVSEFAKDDIIAVEKAA